MCNYGEAVQAYGERLGVQAGQVKLILSTMRKHGWDVEKTMKFMDVDREDRSLLAVSVQQHIAKNGRESGRARV